MTRQRSPTFRWLSAGPTLAEAASGCRALANAAWRCPPCRVLLAGPVSYTAGRRPVLMVGLGTLVAASVGIMLADSVVWLLAARALQGLATGLVLSAASAALMDLHRRRDGQAVGLHNGVASAGGMGLGVLTGTRPGQGPNQALAPF